MNKKGHPLSQMAFGETKPLYLRTIIFLFTLEPFDWITKLYAPDAIPCKSNVKVTPALVITFNTVLPVISTNRIDSIGWFCFEEITR